MTIDELNKNLRAQSPAAKVTKKAQKRGKIGKLGLVKLTVRAAKETISKE